MNRYSIAICFLLSLAGSISFGQPKVTIHEKFMRFLNNYSIDSLTAITTNDFQLIERYVGHTFDKEAFLDSFVVYSKVIHGKFKTIKNISNTEPVKILVEDQGDYATYLKPKLLTWVITINTKGNQIQSMIADTTKGYKLYLDDFIKKHDSFLKWLQKNYPQENEESLFNNKTDLLSRRLREYSNNR